MLAVEMAGAEWAWIELSRYLYPFVRDREHGLAKTIKIGVETR